LIFHNMGFLKKKKLVGSQNSIIFSTVILYVSLCRYLDVDQLIHDEKKIVGKMSASKFYWKVLNNNK
jgi:hypothetical protein